MDGPSPYQGMVREFIMPKTNRDLLKRQIAHVYHNLSLAGMHLDQVIEVFKPVHPDKVQGLEQVLIGIAIMQDAIQQFAKESWGVDDPPWDSWRNVPKKGVSEVDE